MISSSGESPSSSTSKRPRSSSTPAGAIGSRTRTRGPWPAPAPGARSPPPPAPLAAAGDAALDRRPQLAEHELDRRQRCRDVELVVPTDVADPEDRALQLALSARDRDAVPLPQRERQLAGIHPVRHPRGSHDRRAVLVRREELEPHRLDPGAAGAAE